jgi:hypothetical protein
LAVYLYKHGFSGSIYTNHSAYLYFPV